MQCKPRLFCKVGDCCVSNCAYLKLRNFHEKIYFIRNVQKDPLDIWEKEFFRKKCRFKSLCLPMEEIITCGLTLQRLLQGFYVCVSIIPCELPIRPAPRSPPGVGFIMGWIFIMGHIIFCLLFVQHNANKKVCLLLLNKM